MSTRMHSYLSKQGGTYYFTTTIIGWKHVFIKKIYLDLIIESIIFFQNNRKVSTVGYCIMPNHIHWIFKLSDTDQNIVKVIRTFKSYTATQSIKLLKNERKSLEQEILCIYYKNPAIKKKSADNLLNYFISSDSQSSDWESRMEALPLLTRNV